MTETSPTLLLYHNDSYLRNFAGRVLAVEGSRIALDQTAFYPGGGGQLADGGELRWEERRLPLASVRKEGDVVWHTLAPEAGEAPPVGASLRGEVDWAFRYRMMRTHTALHLLCGIIFKDFGAQVTGNQMYVDRARMDFSIEMLSPEVVRAIEARVNEAIAEDHPIKVYTLPRDQALTIPDLIRTKINLLPPQIASIRIVEITGVDLQADGGTHVRSTREVGGVRVLKTENKGKQNKRMEIMLVESEKTEL